MPDKITEVVRDGTLHAWNANFERILWKYILTPRYGWPEPGLTQWRDTMAEGRAFGLPGALKDAALALGVEQLKDACGERLMKRMAKPRRWDAGEPVWWNDDEKRSRLIDYCKQDVRTEMALSKAIPPLSVPELKTYHFDQIINDRGLDVDMRLVAASQSMIALASITMVSDLPLPCVCQTTPMRWSPVGLDARMVCSMALLTARPVPTE